MSIGITKTATGDGVSELVQLHICVQDEDWLGTFDRIEVERSRGLSTGPFEPLTADTWEAARIPKDGGDAAASPPTGPTLAIVGDTLELRVNEQDDYTVTFTDPGPGVLTQAEAVSQINTALPQVVQAWIDSDATIVLATYEAGTGAALRVVGGDAAPKLGLPTTEPDSISFGKAAKLALVPGKERYTFVDIRGATEYFYRTRFFSTVNNTASEYSHPQLSTQFSGVDAGNLVCGQVRLSRMNGQPLSGVQVRVINRSGLHETEGWLVAGRQLQAITDDGGLASFTLIRGMQVDVAIDGTSLVRTLTVPTDPEEGVFNLLDPALGPDDYFRVKHPDIEYAYKRTL